MANTPSNMLALGTKAPFFELPNPAKNNELQSLEDLKGSKGTLVIFMCNHCPFVIHVIEKLAELYEDYKGKGIEFIAINSNDVINYPADSPELMVDFAEEKGFTFPYLYDESQAVAKVYALKRRDDSKALICLVDSDDRLQRPMMRHVRQIFISLMTSWI